VCGTLAHDWGVATWPHRLGHPVGVAAGRLFERSPPSLACALVVLVVTMSASVVGCSDSGDHSTGRFAATVREVGGPAPGLNRLVPAKVTLTDESGHTRTATSATGRVSLDLVAGDYRASATSPVIDSGHSPCTGTTQITIRRGETTRASFVCDVR
jgi:hypothetical protein